MYGTWAVSDAAFNSLVNLCADICKRYGFLLTFTGGTDGTLTRHNFYASTNCPGPYLEAKTAELVKRVNAIVKGDDMPTPADVWGYNWNNTAPGGNMYNAILGMYSYMRKVGENVDKLNDNTEKLADSIDKLVNTLEEEKEQ